MGSYRKSDNYRDRGDSRQLRFRRQSRSSAIGPRVVSKSTSIDNDRCFSCRQLDHFAKDCPEKDTSVGKVNEYDGKWERYDV